MDIHTIHNNIKLIAIERDWCKNGTYAPITRNATTNTITFKLKQMNKSFSDLVNDYGIIISLKYLKEIILYNLPELRNSGYQLCLTYSHMGSMGERNPKNYLKL